jgi:glycosyltransferase involved in cell wall biosynthesis
VLGAYHLPRDFIYLPNQFWQHKNHTAVLEALALLAARGLYPVIVCTGNLNDYRRPAYFSELLQTLSRLNLREQFIVLGQVPRADVFRLVRAAKCVLSPSLFEGLGLSIAESISIGKRMVISDLPSLREQNAPDALYFDPACIPDLADKLALAWSTYPAGPDLAREAAARRDLPVRQAHFGHNLLNLFDEAIGAFQQAHAPSRRGRAQPA